MSTHITPDAATSLWGLLDLRTQVSGDAVALIDEAGRETTFAELRDTAEQVAAGLLGLGIRPGMTVSWQLPTRIDTVVVSMALARLGVTQNPIIPLYRAREVGAMVAQCGSDWLITVGEFRGYDHAAMAQEVRSGLDGQLEVLVLGTELPSADPATLPAPAVDPEAVRWIYTTSGTTSAPKGVCHTDGTLIAGGVALADAIGAGAEDVANILFPYAHIGGPDLFIASLTTGMSLVLMEIYEPVAAVALMKRTGTTITGGSTPHYALLLDEQRKHPQAPVVPTLRMVAGGGAPMPEKLFHEVLNEVGVPVLHAYGMTECPMITSARPDDTVTQLATTSGRPVLNCEIEIRSEDGEVLEVGQVGRVWLRGPMLFKHYLADGEIVRPFDANGWLFTGDTGRLEREGHLVLVGREKDLIIRKGESISPSEIEDVIATFPSVAGVAVIGLPDDRWGERICAVVELREGAEVPDISELREHCRVAGISPAKFPEEVLAVSELPRTPTLKIRKQELRTSVLDRPAHRAD